MGRRGGPGKTCRASQGCPDEWGSCPPARRCYNGTSHPIGCDTLPVHVAVCPERVPLGLPDAADVIVLQADPSTDLDKGLREIGVTEPEFIRREGIGEGKVDDERPSVALLPPAPQQLPHI